MIIKLKYFEIPRNLVKNEKEELELPQGANIEQLITVLVDKMGPASEDLLNRATFLVNQSTGKKDTVLKNGDEVFVLHTLGGG